MLRTLLLGLAMLAGCSVVKNSCTEESMRASSSNRRTTIRSCAVALSGAS